MNIEIHQLVGNILNIIWPILSREAAKALGKTIGSIPDKIWESIKERFEAKPETKNLPDDLARSPEDPNVRDAFQYQLNKLLENDEIFARELEKLVIDFRKYGGTTIKVEGDGAAAVGNGAVAVGKGSVYIGGNASSNIIVAGDENTVDANQKKKKK